MNILVCGTREKLTQEQQNTVIDVLRHYHTHDPQNGMVLIEGGATGVDSFAYGCAHGWGWGTRRFPADWTTFGNAAGPIRNQQMLDENDVDLVLAFPGPESRGTWDMVERAVKNRIPVRVYPLG